MSRKWWIPVGLGILGTVIGIAIVKAMNPYPTPQEMSSEMIVIKFVAGILVGFIAFGIATLIRRRKQAAKLSN